MATQRRTVLLVEDDRATRELFAEALHWAGLGVLAAGDGLTALRILDQQRPDVVVLDLELPHVSGLDVHQEILAHAETRDVPVVIVTGTDWPAPPGTFRILRKPIGADVVVTTVLSALAGSDPVIASRPGGGL